MSTIEGNKKYDADQLKAALNKIKNTKPRLTAVTKAQDANNAKDKQAQEFLARESARLVALIELRGENHPAGECLSDAQQIFADIEEKRSKELQERADAVAANELALREQAEAERVKAERLLAAEKKAAERGARARLGKPGGANLSGAAVIPDEENEDQITVEQLSLFAESLAEGFDEADYADFVLEIEFQGFDPKRLLGYMKKKEPSEDTLKEDAKKLILLTLVRGTNFPKALKSMSKAGSRECQRLINKYTVKPNTKNDRHALTLSRIVCAFPLMAANFRSKGMGRVVGQPGLLPLYLQFNGSPALMVGAEMDKLYHHYLLWQVSFSSVVNRGKFDVNQILNFANVQRTSSYYNSAKCQEYMLRYNVRLEEIEEVPVDRQLKPEPMRPAVRSRREDQDEM